jgi:hypothetical protein
VSRVTELIVPRRFCGPPDSGNGGWTAGALATTLACEPADHVGAWPAIEVSLRQPPPLDAPLDVVVGPDDTSTATFGGAVIATARCARDVDLEEVERIDADVARAAEAAYAGHAFHPFPTCFACGTGREEGDGLRIFPGPVDGRETGHGAEDGADDGAGDTTGDGPAGHRVAATWTPHRSVSEDWHTYVDDDARASVAATWAALDCVGGWAGDLTERLMVLGRMTTRIDTLPVIGEEHVVVGAGRRREGRKTFTASTLYDADGRVVATAEHVWIAVDPALFGGRRPSD